MIHAPRAVDLAATHLRSGILDGTYAAGTNLPPERDLAVELGISRLTLRAALARLESEGLVRPKQGSGVRVLDVREEAGVEALVALLDAGRTDLLGPFLQLRRALASEAVAEACRRATDDELADLTERAARLAIADRSELVAGNLAFARQVAVISGNLPMILLFNTVARAYRARPEIAAAMLVHEAGVRASFAAIVALIAARDPDAARERVRRALEVLDAATLSALEAP